MCVCVYASVALIVKWSMFNWQNRHKTSAERSSSGKRVAAATVQRSSSRVAEAEFGRGVQRVDCTFTAAIAFLHTQHPCCCCCCFCCGLYLPVLLLIAVARPLAARLPLTRVELPIYYLYFFPLLYTFH